MNIIEIAEKASQGFSRELHQFKAFAKANGFTGGPGGWITWTNPTGGESRVQGWQTLAGMVASGAVTFATDVTDVTTPAAARAPKAKPLSPAMESLVRALNEYGYIDPIRDCGRRQGVNTLVALMDRGIIREAKHRHGVHFPATTPEQVWDEAHAENDRRAAERAAHAECAEQWLTTVDDEGRQMHTRNTRTGGTIRVHGNSFRSWAVVAPGQRYGMTAGGTWQEARRAADRFEREQAHAGALDEYREATRAARQADSAAYQRGLAQKLGLKAGGTCPAGHVGTVLTAGGTCADCEQPEGWGQPDGMLGATEAELTEVRTAPAGTRTCVRMDGEHSTHGYARYGQGCYVRLGETPAEARTGISDRVAAALSGVGNLRLAVSIMETELHWPKSAEIAAALDCIEMALRECKSA